MTCRWLKKSVKKKRDQFEENVIRDFGAFRTPRKIASSNRSEMEFKRITSTPVRIQRTARPIEPKTRSHEETSTSSERTQVYGDIPQTTNILFTLQEFHMGIWQTRISMSSLHVRCPQTLSCGSSDDLSRIRKERVCTLNVHRRCVKNVANNCGINPREMADTLRSCGLNVSKNVDWPGGNGSFSVSSVSGSGSGLHRDLSQQSSNILNIMSDKHSSQDKRNAMNFDAEFTKEEPVLTPVPVDVTLSINQEEFQAENRFEENFNEQSAINKNDCYDLKCFGSGSSNNGLRTNSRITCIEQQSFLDLNTNSIKLDIKYAICNEDTDHLNNKMLCYERSSVLFVFKRGLLNRVVLWNGVYNLESIFTMLACSKPQVLNSTYMPSHVMLDLNGKRILRSINTSYHCAPIVLFTLAM
ncbi:hypothetical protein AGLY_014246, partial [Aphis glycines]